MALLWVGYKTINPFPASPNNWAPIVVALWFVLGLVVLAVMRARGREQWLLRAGAVAFEETEPVEARDARPAAGRIATNPR